MKILPDFSTFSAVTIRRFWNIKRAEQRREEKMKMMFRRIAATAMCIYLLSTAALAKELVPVGSDWSGIAGPESDCGGF